MLSVTLSRSFPFGCCSRSSPFLISCMFIFYSLHHCRAGNADVICFRIEPSSLHWGVWLCSRYCLSNVSILTSSLYLYIAGIHKTSLARTCTCSTPVKLFTRPLSHALSLYLSIYLSIHLILRLTRFFSLSPLSQIQPELFVDTSRNEKMRINVDIVFHHMPCTCTLRSFESLKEPTFRVLA